MTPAELQWLLTGLLAGIGGTWTGFAIYDALDPNRQDQRDRDRRLRQVADMNRRYDEQYVQNQRELAERDARQRSGMAP